MVHEVNEIVEDRISVESADNEDLAVSVASEDPRGNAETVDNNAALAVTVGRTISVDHAECKIVMDAADLLVAKEDSAVIEVNEANVAHVTTVASADLVASVVSVDRRANAAIEDNNVDLVVNAVRTISADNEECKIEGLAANAVNVDPKVNEGKEDQEANVVRTTNVARAAKVAAG